MTAARLWVAASVCTAPWLLPALAAPQQLGLGQGLHIAWWRIGLSLGLCILLAFGGALALKARMNGGLQKPGALRLPSVMITKKLGLTSGRNRRLILVEILRLNPQVQVCLFRCDSREFTVAISGQGQLTLLDQTPAPAPKAAP